MQYLARCENARNLMEERGIDCLLVAMHACLNFSGYKKPSPHYKVFMLLPRERTPVLVLPNGQRGNAEEMCWLYPDNIRTFGIETATMPRNPIKLLLEIMEDIDLTDKIIAAELHRMPIDMTMIEFEALKSGLPKAKFVDADEVICQMRVIKSSDEIQAMHACIVRCLEKLGIKGMKLHGGADFPVGGESVRPFMEICKKYKIPVTFHIGISNPRYRRFPKVTVIVAHVPRAHACMQLDYPLHLHRVWNKGWYNNLRLLMRDVQFNLVSRFWVFWVMLGSPPSVNCARATRN